MVTFNYKQEVEIWQCEKYIRARGFCADCTTDRSLLLHCACTTDRSAIMLLFFSSNHNNYRNTSVIVDLVMRQIPLSTEHISNVI